MKQKTRLTPTAQLERTMAHAMTVCGYGPYHFGGYTPPPSDEDLYGKLLLGVVTRNTRLFHRGDLVVIEINNGGGRRWPVTAVSSKGQKVDQMYMSFFVEYPHHRVRTRSGKGYRNFREHPRPEGRKVCHVALVEKSGQPVRFLDVFQCWPVDLTAQREIVATLIAGSVVSP